MTTGTSRIWGKGVVACAAGDTLTHSPVHGFGIVRTAGYVRKATCCGGGLARQLPEIGYSYTTGAGVICPKRRTRDKALFIGPQRGFGVIIVVRHIAERVFNCGLRGTLGTPEERQNLCGSASLVGGKGGSAGAAGDSVLYRPSHGGGEIFADRDIGKAAHSGGRITGTAIMGSVRVYVGGVGFMAERKVKRGRVEPARIISVTDYRSIVAEDDWFAPGRIDVDPPTICKDQIPSVWRTTIDHTGHK